MRDDTSRGGRRTDGGYYHNFIDNALRMFASGRHDYRDNSIESLVLNTFHVFSLDTGPAQTLVGVLKAILTAASLGLLWACVHRRLFYQGSPEEFVLNGTIVLMFPMVMLSPMVWGHHPVLLVFPFLVLLKQVAGVEDLLAFLAAHFLIFLLPSFDAYPLVLSPIPGVLAVPVPALPIRASRATGSFGVVRAAERRCPPLDVTGVSSTPLSGPQPCHWM